MTTIRSFYQFINHKTEPTNSFWFHGLYENKLRQGDVFRGDSIALLRDAKIFLGREGLFLARNIGTIVIAPFSLISDVFRYPLSSSVSISTILQNFVDIPVYTFYALTSLVLKILLIPHRLISGASATIGTAAWHSGEFCVRKISLLSSNSKPENADRTILSNSRNIRHIVYESIGITLLSMGALFAPITAVRLLALPVVFGSLYGTVNNQFTTRECPEYYTMGHYYDGSDLKGHAVKTFNPTIKSIVTGCYATTMVTRLAGYTLAAAGALPFAAATVPMSYTVSMIAGFVIFGVIAAHFISRMRRAKVIAFEANVREFARLYRFEINEDYSTDHLMNLLRELPEPSDLSENERIRAQELWRLIEKHHILIPNVPLRYQKGWEGNNTRNTVGYIIVGVGTVAMVAMTVYLRIYVY